MNSKRLSNFELLRIFAMIMIMTSHIFQHGVNIQIFDEQYSPAGEYFSNFIFYKKLVITYYARCFGIIGNVIFLMISGYFLIDKRHINIGKQTKKILTQVLYVTLALMLVSMIFLRKSIIMTGSVVLDAFNNDWWFLGLYIFAIVSADLFFNDYIADNKEGHKKCLIILFPFLCIGYLRSFLNGIGGGLQNLSAAVFMYLLGGYIKKYNPFEKVRTYFLVLLLVLTFLIMAISYYNFTVNSINQALIDNEENYFQLEYKNYGLTVLPCMVIGVIIFEIFNRIKLKSVAFINYVAGATFIMYISHENSFMWELLMKIRWNELLYTGDYIHFCLYLFLILLSFIALGVILYSIYLLLDWLVNKNSVKRIFLKI